MLESLFFQDIWHIIHLKQKYVAHSTYKIIQLSKPAHNLDILICLV